MIISKKAFQIILIVLVVRCSESFAYESAITTGTAGAGYSAVEASDSAFLNPATLPFLQGYFLTLSTYGSRDRQIQTDSDGLAVSLIDNMKTTVFPTALSYEQNKAEIEEGGSDLAHKRFRLSLGNFVGQQFTLGAALFHQQSSLANETWHQTNMNIAALWSPNEMIGMSLITENMFMAPEKLSEDRRLQKRSIFATSFNYHKFARFKLDLATGSNNDFDAGEVRFGLESYMNPWVVIRVGVGKIFPTKTAIYSGGLGFAGPQFGIHYGYQVGQESADFVRHAVDLVVPFW